MATLYQTRTTNTSYVGLTIIRETDKNFYNWDDSAFEAYSFFEDYYGYYADAFVLINDEDPTSYYTMMLEHDFPTISAGYYTIVIGWFGTTPLYLNNIGSQNVPTETRKIYWDGTNLYNADVYRLITAIKGSGWTDETLKAINDHIETVDGIVDDILIDTGTTLDGKLDTIDGIVDDIVADTNELQTDDIPGTLSTMDGKLDTIDGVADAILVDTGTTLDGKIDTIDGNVDAILTDTGTTLDGKLNTIDTNVDDIETAVGALNDLTAQQVWEYATRTLTDPNSYKADISALALEATLTAIKGGGWSNETLKAIKDAIDVVDGIVDDVLEDTGTTLDGIVDSILEDTGTTIPATITTIDNEIETIDGIVDNILVDTGTTIPGTITTIDGIVDDILEDTGTTLPTAIAAIDTDSVMDAEVEGGYTVTEILRIMVGALAGKLSGGGTTTLTFRDLSDTLNRIVATVDNDGNRTAITLDES